MSTDLVFPRELPAPQLAGHALRAVDHAERIAFEMGEARVRRLFRRAPRVASVSWVLDQAAFDTFASWFEEDLEAGSRPFDVQLAGQGTAGAWHTATFVAPYSWEYLSHWRGGQYRVSGELFIVQPPFGERTPPPLRARASLSVGLEAILSAPVTLQSRMTVDIGMSARDLIVTRSLRGEFALEVDVRGVLSFGAAHLSALAGIGVDVLAELTSLESGCAPFEVLTSGAAIGVDEAIAPLESGDTIEVCEELISP